MYMNRRYTYDSQTHSRLSPQLNNQSTVYAYDNFNHLIQIENALGEITTYTNDVNGNVLTQTDGLGNVTTVVYNPRNLPMYRVEPGGFTVVIGGGNGSIINSRATYYNYRADGSIENVTDQNGQITHYTYDIHGHVISVTTGTMSITYTYDNNGNVLTHTDERGTTTYTYDALNRVTSKDEPGIGLTTYLYDITAGMPSGYVAQTTTDPKGNTTTKIYDKAGRLHQVISGGDTTTYEYYPNGNRMTATYPNGVESHYTYYSDSRLQSLAHIRGNTYISTYTYGYDGNGNMSVIADQNGMTMYEYDALGRLAMAEEPDGRVVEYTYDAAGNRLTETVTENNEVSITYYSYNEQGRLMNSLELPASGGEKTTEYFYDNNGSQTSKLITAVAPATPGDITYENSTYDELGRLASVENDEYSADYAYNANGLRISKSITSGNATTETHFLYENGCITLELDSNGNQTARNVFAMGSIISRTTAQGTLYYLYDGRGNVAHLTNSMGYSVKDYEYDAFGNEKNPGTNDTNPFRYRGEYFDNETRTYYLRARNYDPSTGRFTQRDAFIGFHDDPLSLNRYTYGHNNPIRYRDPSGYVVTQADINNAYANHSPAEAARLIAQIQQATDAWNAASAANDRAAMDAAHAMANAARSQSLAAGQYITSYGYTRNADGAMAVGGNSHVYLNTGDGTSLVMNILIKEIQSDGQMARNTSDIGAVVLSSNLLSRDYVPLNLGDRADNVRMIQGILTNLGFYGGLGRDADSVFGTNTLAAVMRFQMFFMEISFDSLFDDKGKYKGLDQKTGMYLGAMTRTYSVEPFRGWLIDVAGYGNVKIDGHIGTTPSEYVRVVDNEAHMRHLVSGYQLNQIYKETGHFQYGKVIPEMVMSLNKALYRFNITTSDLIQYFMAVAMHESRPALIQTGTDHPWKGAGYIQLSNRDNYQAFSDYLTNDGREDPRIMSSSYNPQEIIEDYYAWEASGWWWDFRDNRMNSRITESQAQGLGDMEIFRRISNQVRHGDYDRVENPQHWYDRWDRYKKVIRVFG